MKEIVLAGGCFWGVEAYFDGKKGLLSTKVGYANGYIKNPTYEKVCHEDTGFAEACYVSYDESIVSLDNILNWYWKIVDPTLLNRQGHDLGNQYRTGIYYFTNEDLDVIMESKANEQKKYDKPIVTEIEPLETFYEAEEYHQKYLKKNPNGYCHIPKELLE